MNITLRILAVVGLAASGLAARDLTYTQPAEKWVEALPVGNGRLGAMIFGAVAKERIALNDNTLWSGGPKDWNNPGAEDVLPLVRAAVMAGNYAEAEKLCKQMQGPYTQNYLPLGDPSWSLRAWRRRPITSARWTSTARSRR